VGHVYDCSVIDYELDSLGIETPCQIDKSGIKVENQGKKTIISFNAAIDRQLSLKDIQQVADEDDETTEE
jgi:hypothetical protein